MKAVGTDQEVSFWAKFVQTERFTEDWCANKKTGELHPYVYQELQVLNPRSVLDVGSGACSLLHGSVKNYEAYDLLADEYRGLFDYSKYPDVVIPKPVAGEDITDIEKYDVVHMSNAIDHTTDPVRVFNNLLRATKVGGLLIIQGFQNEAVQENWKGMHQWNMSLRPTTHSVDFMISGKGGEGGVFKVMADSDFIMLDEAWNPKGWIILIVRKTSETKEMQVI